MRIIQARIRTYLTPPSGSDPCFRRLFILGSVTCLPAILIHVLYVPLFLWMQLPVLAVFNIGSVIAWIVVLMLIRRGRFTAAWCLSATEMLIQAGLCVHYAGWGFGFQYFLFTLAGLCFILPGRRWLSLATAGAAMIEFAILSRWADQVPWPGSAALLYVFNLINVFTAFGLALANTIYNQSLIDRAEEAVRLEHARSEALLMNVFPTVIATRLTQDPAAVADRFASASILFADIANFTPLAQRLSPVHVVQLLDDLFSRFDDLVRKHQLEKIKTVGDAYMVAAGVPQSNDHHAEALAEFAFDLKQCVAAFNAETGRDLHLRIGINSGPVVAGVIGKWRFLYDLWGDCGNTASRMESHGVPDEIQVSEETRNLLADKYIFEERGIIEIKGKGPMPTYFLRGPKSVAAQQRFAADSRSAALHASG